MNNTWLGQPDLSLTSILIPVSTALDLLSISCLRAKGKNIRGVDWSASCFIKHLSVGQGEQGAVWLPQSWRRLTPQLPMWLPSPAPPDLPAPLAAVLDLEDATSAQRKQNSILHLFLFHIYIICILMEYLHDTYWMLKCEAYNQSTLCGLQYPTMQYAWSFICSMANNDLILKSLSWLLIDWSAKY